MDPLHEAILEKGIGGALGRPDFDITPTIGAIQPVRITWSGPGGAWVGSSAGLVATAKTASIPSGRLEEALGELAPEARRGITEALGNFGPVAGGCLIACVEHIEVAEPHRGIGLPAWLLAVHLISLSEAADKAPILVAMPNFDLADLDRPGPPPEPAAGWLAGIRELDDLEADISDASVRIMRALGSIDYG